MADNTDILALLGEILRATDRQTDSLRAEMQRNAQETNERFEAMFNHFAAAVADGFIRNEKKLNEVKQEVVGVKQEVAGVKQEVAGVKQEVAGVKQEVAGVKQEVAELRQDVQRMDQRLERVEANQPTLQDIVRRLTVVETIVLPKAS